MGPEGGPEGDPGGGPKGVQIGSKRGSSRGSRFGGPRFVPTQQMEWLFLQKHKLEGFFL